MDTTSDSSNLHPPNSSKRPAADAFDDDIAQFLNDDFVENSKFFFNFRFCF